MATASPPGASRSQESLTRREIEVIQLVATGLSGREVAQRLCRSPRTVENHLRSVYQKLGVRNRVELMRVGAERGLLAQPGAGVSASVGSMLEVKSRTLDIIHELDTRMARADNDQYFGALAIGLTSALGVRWAGLSEPSASRDLMDIIVMAADGALTEQLSCQTDCSPCGRTMAEGSVVITDDLAAAFPDWQLGKDFGVRAYVGVRLDDRVVGTVGTLWVMDDKPIDPDTGVELILRLFGRRTAAELALAQMLDRQAADGETNDPDSAQLEASLRLPDSGGPASTR